VRGRQILVRHALGYRTEAMRTSQNSVKAKFNFRDFIFYDVGCISWETAASAVRIVSATTCGCDIMITWELSTSVIVAELLRLALLCEGQLTPLLGTAHPQMGQFA